MSQGDREVGPVRIMVGIDDSAAAHAAMEWSLGVAARSGATIEAVRSWSYSARPLQDLPGVEVMDRQAEEAVARELAAHDLDGVDVATSVVRGPARHALLQLAEERRPDVFVVGRRSGGERRTSATLGSVSRRLVEAAPCPVVVVSEGRGLDRHSPLRLLVAVDGSEASERALRWGADFAAGTGASIVLAHVIGPTTGIGAVEVAEADTEALLGRCAASVGGAVEVTTVVGYGDPRRELERLAAEHLADLVVVGPRGLGALARLVTGTVASHLAEYADVPVAVVPA